MAGYIYIKDNCDDSCRVEPFDTDGPCLEACGDECIDCARSAGPCSCTCKLMAFVCIAEINGVAEDSGTEIPPFHYCKCQGAEGPENSLDPTRVTTGAYLRWTYDGLREGEGDADMTPAAIAARTCPENPDWAMKFYGVYGDVDSHCIVDFKQEGVRQLSVAGYGLDPIINPPASAGYDYYLDALMPAIAEGTERYLCAGLREGARELPHTILAVLRNSCGAIMAICPIAANLSDQVFCTPPVACCHPIITFVCADPCDETGRATVHFNVDIECPSPECATTGGILVVSLDDPTADPPFITFNPAGGGGMGSFTVACTGDPDQTVQLSAEYNSFVTCVGEVDCSFWISDVRTVSLTGGSAC